MFKSNPRNFRIGNSIQAKRNLNRFVKWPRYIRIQRQRKILYTRLKVPPSINQFNRTLSKDQANELFNLLNKYKPETKKARIARWKEQAKAKSENKDISDDKKHFYVQFGLNHITYLVEQKKAKLVVIAHDVDPIELVVWLPALCRKMGVPFCIVKGKAKLGQLVGQKTATCVALTGVRGGDATQLSKVAGTCTEMFNNFTTLKWGGGQMGLKTQRRLQKREQELEKERKQREGL